MIVVRSHMCATILNIIKHNLIHHGGETLKINRNKPQENPDDMPKRIDRRTVKRSVVVFFVFICVAFIAIAVLFKMEIIDYDIYREKVSDQLTVETTVNPERGNITDRNGNVLATNISEYLIIISPQDIIDVFIPDEEDVKNGKEIPTFDYVDASGSNHNGIKMDEFVSRRLADILSEYDVTYDYVMGKAQKEGRRYEEICSGVSEDHADEIREFISEYNLKNQIIIRSSPKRYYPYSDLCAHVIGFTDKDGAGIYGLERYYNNILEGTSGRYITAQDAHSNDMPFSYESFVEAENGYNIETTIDVNIQYELEKQLEETYNDNGGDERVCGIVMDVNTGGILAMATYPTFDLNNPRILDDVSKSKLSEYTEGTDEYNEKYLELLYYMWSNKAVTTLYEPGSTFKPITTTMAFEENVITENTIFTCTGSYSVDGYPRPIACHKAEGHGTVPFYEGLQQSCNPTLMQVAQLVGIPKFYSYFRAYGYTEKTGIDLPAEASSIYTVEDNFTGVSLAVYSFGQTFKVTPIQHIDALAAIANGGNLLTPHLISRILDDDGNVIYEYETDVRRNVVSENTCDRVTKILEEGVSGNGGAKNAYVRGYKVAGKTGTSEKKDKKDENGDYSYRVGSTMGYAPAYDPEVIALIINDEPTKGNCYGSVVAAPYISNLLAFTLPYLGYEPEYSSEELQAIEVTVGTYVESTVTAAIGYIREIGLQYEVIGDGEKVTSQIPESGTSVLKENGKVLIFADGATSTESVSVPNFVGIGVEAANQIITNSGLNVSFTGTQSLESGVIVTEQSIAPETEVPKGTVITLTIKHMDGTD